MRGPLRAGCRKRREARGPPESARCKVLVVQRGVAGELEDGFQVLDRGAEGFQPPPRRSRRTRRGAVGPRPRPRSGRDGAPRPSAAASGVSRSSVQGSQTCLTRSFSKLSLAWAEAGEVVPVRVGGDEQVEAAVADLVDDVLHDRPHPGVAPGCLSRRRSRSGRRRACRSLARKARRKQSPGPVQYMRTTAPPSRRACILSVHSAASSGWPRCSMAKASTPPAAGSGRSRWRAATCRPCAM